jgi:two-component system cell cycle sensor histidine kinase/response regulator CckA
VVEDHAEVRRLAAEALRRSGYDVVEAGTPREAEAAFSRGGGKIDLLLADVVMPERNGWDLAMHFRELQPDLHVVLMSGYAESAISEEQMAEKGVSFIQKPFNPAELSAMIGRVLRRA